MSAKPIVAMLAALALLAGCAHPGQNRYGYQDVGQNVEVEFGKLLRMREVEITGKNTGTGALVGMTAGAYGGSYVGSGSGSGSLGAALAGAFIGAMAGAAAEQAMQDRKGIEYLVRVESGKTKSIVQNLNKDETPLSVGQRVMIQTSGTYQRVLPADDIPESEPKRKKKAKAKKAEATEGQELLGAAWPMNPYPADAI